MCGIVGFNFKDRELLKKMIKTLNHRGPDNHGFYEDSKISLGHARLSIIDLKKGKQPLKNEKSTVWIVFNGEIFNFQELRRDLEKKDHIFETDTDTEVIIHGYEEYGYDIVKKLNGQFSFCIYDAVKRELFIARDRIGIKPLYYYKKDETLMFASELKAILQDLRVKRDIDKSVIRDYVSYGYVPSPKSIFKNVYKLDPGHYLIYKLKENRLFLKKYWDLHYVPSKTSFNKAKKELLSKLSNSVQKRLIADVPLGAFLSGGIDSSTIVALMSKLKKDVKTFSVGFEGQDDELELAKKTSDMYSTDHKEFVVSPAEFDLFPKLVYYADEPFSDSSLIPTYIVSKMAAKHVKVALSGDGGDENFAGYNRYVKNKYERLYSKVPIYNDRFKRIKEIAKEKNDSLRFIKGNEFFIDSEKDKLLNFKYEQSFKQKHIVNYKDKTNNLLYMDVKTTLVEDYLKKVDVASMANSLEVRTPFLDHKFMEFSASLPGSYKTKGLDKKHILKKAVKGLIPDEVIEGKKRGFSIPLDNWLRKDLKDELYSLTMKCCSRGYFNKDYVEKLWEEHLSNKRDNRARLWNLVSFEIWCRIYLDGIKVSKVLKE
ncbi:asparagine synthase (glutamine-hydrolyzing) [Candidatus Woesearchaeota archaeon]|nr:asparagine synthase (glutamine-hydrolyzing) [Candidatus Woesearchaeota archaeon]